MFAGTATTDTPRVETGRQPSRGLMPGGVREPSFDARARARARLVSRQIAGRGIRDARVLAAMREVPREVFVADGLVEDAYDDSPLPIGSGQTISQPYIVALMIEAAAIGPGDRVLEVGAGSGYAAAVASRIAASVCAIERHAALVEEAEARLRRLGYRNVELRVGDGTRGWPDGGPFDAILVAAGGPQVPATLKQQLAVGGRLVMPVGHLPEQTLQKLTRRRDGSFATETLCGVRFVPLIGAEGWPSDEPLPAPTPLRGLTLSEHIARVAIGLPEPESPDFADSFQDLGDRRVVLLGEATHGTAEFYRARAAITRRLVERHGFRLVAVEADWPDAAVLDRMVRSLPPKAGEAPPFQRFPTWMWRNRETAELLLWLRAYNAGRDPSERAGFYGLDLYNLHGSIAAVLGYLDEVDPAAAEIARERYACLTPWQQAPAVYGRAVLTGGYRSCEAAVVAQCRDLLERRLSGYEDGALLDASRNARLIAAAEQYYRAMYYGGAEAWNLRDRHMAETLGHLLEASGSSSKAVVWAHNSHIGDARATGMGRERHELNLGQLCRERFGAEAALVGFGTHSGTVAAASAWGGPMQVMEVAPAHRDSYEHLCHAAHRSRFLLPLAGNREIASRLRPARPERFIGVVYRPETEFQSHYVKASLPDQFDAWAWFDKTSAVTPLGDTTAPEGGEPDTFPFGV